MGRIGNLLRAVKTDTNAPSITRGFGGGWGRNAVGMSEDLGRIVNLPRRQLKAPPSDYFDKFRLYDCSKTGCDFSGGLRKIQASALLEVEQAGGGFVCASVGLGKTLVSLLAPTVLGAKRTVLLIPPSVKAQLLGRDIPHIKQHWRIPEVVEHSGTGGSVEGLYVVTYSELSNPRNGDLLNQIDPDLIVADECHRVARAQAARTKRFFRHLKTNSLAKLLCLSATVTDRSIRDFAKLLARCLGDRAPIPLRYPVLEEWACAIDGPGYNQQPTEPGHLRLLANSEELACLERGEMDGGVRSAFRRRLKESPGVVFSEGTGVKASLYLHRHLVKVPKLVKEALAQLRETWTTPGGEEITTALDFARHARELSCGMYLKWEPEPTWEWRDARAAWHRETRMAIKDGKPGCDSPLLYANRIAAGDIESQYQNAWLEIAESCAPETVAVWLSEFLLESASEWGQKPGVIWTEHRAVAKELARVSGFNNYSSSTQSKKLGQETGAKSIILSTDAFQEGLDLYQFDRMLYLTPPSNARIFEQTCGRIHRSSQRADEVNVFFGLHTSELVVSLEKARELAKVVATTNGAQKLLYGSWTF